MASFINEQCPNLVDLNVDHIDNDYAVQPRRTTLFKSNYILESRQNAIVNPEKTPVVPSKKFERGRPPANLLVINLIHQHQRFPPSTPSQQAPFFTPKKAVVCTGFTVRADSLAMNSAPGNCIPNDDVQSVASLPTRPFLP